MHFVSNKVWIFKEITQLQFSPAQGIGLKGIAGQYF